jgi:hypothetical protein
MRVLAALAPAMLAVSSSPARADGPLTWLRRRVVDPFLPAARPGEQVSAHIRFEQPWNQLAALAVAGLGAAFIIWLYRREGALPSGLRRLLTGLRIALILLAMFLLSEAVLSVDRTGLPTFVVMVDDSASASIADPYEDPKARATADELAKAAKKDQPSRLALAQGWLGRDDGAVLRDLQKDHRLRLYLASGTARPLAEIDAADQLAPALERLAAAEPTGSSTRLGDAVRQVLTELRGAPPTAILLLTDGQTTDGESLVKASEFARGKGVPLYVIGLGDPAPVRDLELSDLQVDDVVFVDDQVRFVARLTGRGFDGETVEAVLTRLPADADPKGPGEEVGRVSVQVPPDGQPVNVEVRHQPRQPGDHVYRLRVAERPRELQKDNNLSAHTVSVRDQKLRVLLVEGEPRYEFRYLLSFLKRDKSVDLKAVLQSSDPEFSEQELTALPTFPTAKDGPEGLFSYDVVVLGDADARLLGNAPLQNLAEFVERKGGGLMFVAGQNFNPLAYRGTPLERLLPIKLGEARDPAASGLPVAPFRPALTAEGRTHPIFRLADDEAESARVWQSLPDLDWFLEVPRKQELAFVLAAHPTQTGSDGPLPLVLYQYAGAGKVLFQAFDGTWRWRFRTGDRYFGRYWVQALRFLARSKLLGQKQAELLTDRRRYQRSQPVRLQVRFPNPALAPAAGKLTVEVSRDGQPPRRIDLARSPAARNLFDAALPPLAEGSYEARLLPPPVLTGGMPTASFRVDPPAGEFERIPMNQAELTRAADVSRGKFATPAIDPDELVQSLPPPQLVPLETDPPIALWNSRVALGLFLTLLAIEWILRKRAQLV